MPSNIMINLNLFFFFFFSALTPKLLFLFVIDLFHSTDNLFLLLFKTVSNTVSLKILNKIVLWILIAK